MIFDYLKHKVTKNILLLLRNYYKFKYNNSVDVCFVWCENKDTIKFETSTTNGEVGEFEPIRKLCGQNKLILYGPNKLTEIVLLVSPSCFRFQNVKSVIKFINSWPGNSKIEEKEVVRYSRLI